MQKSEPQHNHVQNQPTQRQGRGASLESPQGEQIAQLETMVEASPQAGKLAQLAAMADNSTGMAAQRKAINAIHNSPNVTAQRQRLESLAGEAAQREEAEEPLQEKIAQREEAPAKPNNTGLPDNLKSGIESLSGMSMDNVKVHYNSSQPAQLNALAYAQGTDIHVAPGQEQHLPHEAWHVVQQVQGRVRPTVQMKDGVPVNDDAGLEQEADEMGGRAANFGSVGTKQSIHASSPNVIDQKKTQYSVSVQRVEKVDNSADGPIVAFHLARDLDSKTIEKLMDGIGRTTIRELGTNLILRLIQHTSADHLIEVVLNLTDSQIRQLGKIETEYSGSVFRPFLELPYADIQRLLPMVELDAEITHLTVLSAPAGTSGTRTDVGVGEVVNFKGNVAGDWSADSGAPMSKVGDTEFAWTAPNRAATPKIKFMFKALTEKEASVDMKVTEPAHITADKKREIACTPGMAGAGMKLTFNYYPKTVSFGNVEAKEVSGPGSNVTGYFAGIGDVSHDSGDTFTRIAHDNKDTVEDKAAADDLPGPYSDGTLDWVIPNNFRVVGEGGEKTFTNVTQSFQIWASGKVKITKAGASVERTP